MVLLYLYHLEDLEEVELEKEMHQQKEVELEIVHQLVHHKEIQEDPEIQELELEEAEVEQVQLEVF